MLHQEVIVTHMVQGIDQNIGCLLVDSKRNNLITTLILVILGSTWKEISNSIPNNVGRNWTFLSLTEASAPLDGSLRRFCFPKERIMKDI